jgi:Fic family protein
MYLVQTAPSSTKSFATGECHSKCEHIAGVPLRPDVAADVHLIYLAKGTWGTVAIEGNTLSEAEILQHVHGKLELPPEKEYLKQEADNVIQEFNRMATQVASHEPLVLSFDRIKEVNRNILKGLILEEGIVAGEIRHRPFGVMDYLGAPAEDCTYLLTKMCDWLNGPDFEPQSGFERGHMAILKAIIAHLYVEWIHAFGDGNGRTGRLVEAQVLLATGIPAPAAQLLSNHYNQTRREYYSQLREASRSGGDAVPFICYAVAGLLEGLKGQLQRIRRAQMETAWINYVHDFFRNRPGATAGRQKLLLLDLLRQESPVEVSNVDKISAGTAAQYAGMHPRTKVRDVEALEALNFLVRDGNRVRANIERITAFLPIRAFLE